MSRDKGQIAAMLRQMADQADAGEPIGERLRGAAFVLEKEHRTEQRRAEIAHAGTVECPQCHGWGVYFDQTHIQCPRCRGVGRFPREE